MSDVAGSVYGAIRYALEYNLRDYHQRFGEEELPWSDLYVDIVAAVKWVYETSPETALHLVRRALTDASNSDDGPTLEAAARCLRHSLTQGGSTPQGWTPEQANRFVTAALIAR